MPNYIYALHCPIAKTVRYIGKSNDPEYRLSSHLTSAKSGKYSHYTARWLRKILAAGLRPEMEIIETLDDSEPWEDYERFYIQFGEDFGWKLTNTNPGGEGGGFVRAEDKQRWADSIRAAYTPEVRAHMSSRLKEALNNPRTKELQRANMQKRWNDPEYRSFMVRESARANADPDVKEKRRAVSKARMECPRERKIVSDGLKAFYSTPEGKAYKTEVSRRPKKVEASREGQIKNWQDPEYRERQLAAMRSPESIEKIRAAARDQHADPTIKEKMRQGMREAWVKRKAANPGRTPEQEAVWREERLAKRREKRRLAKADPSV